MKRNNEAPKQPAIQGAIAQVIKILPTPPHPQFTLPMPIDAAAVPTNPPTTAWVVETGRPRLVATVRNKDEDTTVHIIAKSRTDGEASKWCRSTILIRIVSATPLPAAMLPPSSHIEAKNTACFNVRDREETDVANELATSFAPAIARCQTRFTVRGMAPEDSPMFHASRKANIVVMTKI